MKNRTVPPAFSAFRATRTEREHYIDGLYALKCAAELHEHYMSSNAYDTPSGEEARHMSRKIMFNIIEGIAALPWPPSEEKGFAPSGDDNN